MRIVNRRRFMISMCFLFLFLSSIIAGATFSYQERETKEIYVEKGETLWTIASREQEINSYYQNKDIRDVILEIKKVNHITNNETLKIGQKLILYTF